MIEENKNYYINNPIFIKYKRKFNFLKFSRVKKVKKVFINERIVEIPFVIQNIPVSTDVKILDLGCMESSLPIHLASVGYNVIGVDMRPFPYSHPNFKFIEADIVNLPFPDEDFGAVSCVSTLEHIGLSFYTFLYRYRRKYQS